MGNSNPGIATIITSIWNFLTGSLSSESYEEEPRTILCTGSWREMPFRRALLEYALGHPIIELSHEKEGILQAKCAHNLMNNEGYVHHGAGYYLYLGAGRGSVQMTVINNQNEVVDVFTAATGYPKDGSGPDLSLLRETSLRVFEKYGHSMNFIVGFDSIFHVLKKNCPVIADAEKDPENAHLPTSIDTRGSHFAELGYLTDHYAETPMLVVRNFINKDNETWKISFATGTEYMIDLGSGYAKLVDPLTGQQVRNYELPGDWKTNDESLIEISKGLRELLDYADQLDVDESLAHPSN